jgi:serine/threonine-protein kinase
VAENNLFASPLKFGNWLTEHFGAAIVERRRARQRAAKALERGPLVEMKPVPGASSADVSAAEGSAAGVSSVEPSAATAASPARPETEADVQSVSVEPPTEAKETSKPEGESPSEHASGQTRDRPKRKDGRGTPKNKAVPSESQQSPNAGAFVLAALVVMLLLVFWLAR